MGPVASNAWWQQEWRRPIMMKALKGLPRYIAVASVASEHRLPVVSFVSTEIHPGNVTTVFAFDDDYSFGIATQSRGRRDGSTA